MATSTINYGTATALTCSTASIATSTTFLTGRESTEVSNTSNKFIDVLLEGFVTVGTSTSSSVTEIRVYAWGSHTSLASTAKDTLVGADGTRTIVSVGVRDGFLRRASTMRVDASVTDRKYNFGPVSIAQLFGQVPQYWGIFVTHNTGVALNSTAGNHEFKYTGIKFDAA